MAVIIIIAIIVLLVIAYIAIYNDYKRQRFIRTNPGVKSTFSCSVETT